MKSITQTCRGIHHADGEEVDEVDTNEFCLNGAATDVGTVLSLRTLTLRRSLFFFCK